LQIRELAKFGSRVSAASEREIGERNATAIVGQFDPGKTAIFQEDRNASRACVEGILEKLFDNVCGLVDHFSGGDGVNDGFGELDDVGDFHPAKNDAKRSPTQRDTCSRK
jgi:hypothetical protein